MVASLRKLKGARKGFFADIFESPIPKSFLTTGFMTLDTALGGGIGEGGLVEIFGAEHCGKTYASIQFIGANLQKGQLAVVQDYEHTFDPTHAAAVSGCKVIHLSEAEEFFETAPEDHDPVLIWSQPLTFEAGADLSVDLIETFGAKYRFLLVDSVAAMTPKAVLEGSAEDSFPAIRARLMSQWLSKSIGRFHKNRTTMLFVNQIRDKIDAGGAWGADNTYTTGGRSLKFYATQRIKFSNGERHDWKGILGDSSHVTYIQVIKNKCAPTRRGRTILVHWPRRGFSPEIELLSLAMEAKVIGDGPGGEVTVGGAKTTRRHCLKTLVKAEPAKRKKFRDFLVNGVREVLGENIWFKEYTPSAEFDLDEAE